MRGEGERWRMVESLFQLTCRRLGMDDGEARLARPRDKHERQGQLFQD